MKRLILFLTLLALTSPAFGQMTNTQRQELPSVNLLQNPGFENGKVRWSATAGTFAVTTTTANVGAGSTAASYQATGSSQLLASAAVTLPAGLFGAQCSASVLQKGGDANLVLEVYDATTTTALASLTLAAQTNFVTDLLTFTCPTAGDSLQLRIRSTASSAVVYLDQAFLGSLARPTVVAVSPTAYSQTPIAVTAVGTAGFPQLGHVLTTADFTALASNQFAFYNLAANPNDGSTQAINLTANGTPTYTTTNVLGTTSAASTLNGTSQYYSASSSFFNPGNASYAVGAWVKLSNWASGSAQAVIGTNQSGSDRGFLIQVQSTGIFFGATATASTYDFSATVPDSFSANSWHHLAMVYNATAQTLTPYIDGKVASTPVPMTSQRSVSTMTNSFVIGAVYATATGNFLAGSVEEAFAVSGYAMTADDIRKLAARRIDHNKAVATSSQLWNANWGRSDSNVGVQLDSSWLVSKSNNSVWADFSGVATGAFVDLSMQNTGLVGTNVVANSTYDSGVLSAAPSTTIAHNLGVRPAAIVYEYETSTGHFTPLQGSNFCEADAVNLYCDWTGLSVSASNRLEIIAGGTPIATAIPLADATTNGIVNSNGAQTIGGAKTLTGVANLSGGYYGNKPTVLYGTASVGSGGGSAAGPTSFSTVSSDSSYFTSQSASGTGTSVVLTMTIARAGYYRMDVSMYNANGTANTYARYVQCLGGTSTLLAPNAGGECQSTETTMATGVAATTFPSFWNVTAAGQTITINPWAQFTNSSATNFRVHITLTPL